MASLDLDAIQRALAPNYRLEREIGTGGHATVYLAQDQKHNRAVALKLLRSVLFETVGPERFVREIAVTARLAHPHILPLLDSGTAVGIPFYVMPFVAGESLGDRLRRETRLPVRDTIDIGVQVADALAYAHAQGILHRDIKPANIMLFERHALVTDFGIAKAIGGIASDTGRTQAGFAVGTPTYMSPEQVGGDEQLDERSDEFSLALTLYECLVGDVPQAGGPARITLVKRMTESVPSARSRRSDIPVELDRVLGRALATDPAGRFATLRDFGAALSAVAAGGVSSSQVDLAATPPPAPVSLAVLPFENLSADPEVEHLADGIAEEITTMLSRLHTIRVCSRASSFAFRDQSADLAVVAERLNVTRLLMGTVRRAAGRLRVSAQLIDPKTGFVIWSERFDRAAADILSIEEEIGNSIADSLKVSFLGSQVSAVTAAQPASSAAYDQYLQGRHQWNRRTESGIWRGIEHLDRVITIDPNFARGHAALGDAWAGLAIIGAAPPHEAMGRAREFAARALELDPSLAEALATRALIRATYEWDRVRAEREYRDAITLNRNYAPAHQWLATTVLVVDSRFDEALAEMELALACDPLSPVMLVTEATIYYYSRRFPEAVASARRALDLDSGFALAHYFLSLAHVAAGEPAAAVRHGELASELSRESTEALAGLGHAVAAAGDRDRALTILDSLTQRAAQSYVPPTHTAQIWSALGEVEKTLDDLEAAATVRAPDLIWAGVRPTYDPVRNEPRFDRLVERFRRAGAGSG